MPHKILRRELREFPRKRQNQHLLDAFLFHQFSAPAGGSHQPRRPVRRHYAGGMWFECEHRRLPAALLGQGFEAPQNPPVTEVYTVEIADGEAARTEIGRFFVQAVVDFHATWISSPS